MGMNLFRLKHVANFPSSKVVCIMQGNRVVISVNLRQKTLTVFHDGHPCTRAMKSSARAHSWCPGTCIDNTDNGRSCK